MKIAPTLQGGLRIDIDSLIDWARLELIVIDAAKLENGPEDGLASKLASKMTMEDDWKNYVLPDIEEHFSEQQQFIQREIRIARSKNPEAGEIHITPENVGLWYGALNQARIALENELKLSQYEQPTEEEFHNLSEEVKAGLLKSHFYGAIQMHLLEHVMR